MVCYNQQLWNLLLWPRFPVLVVYLVKGGAVAFYSSPHLRQGNAYQVFPQKSLIETPGIPLGECTTCSLRLNKQPVLKHKALHHTSRILVPISEG